MSSKNTVSGPFLVCLDEDIISVFEANPEQTPPDN
jgi:hypothetical protein